MRYIAALDYAHLDNGMFLTALARSISQQGEVQPIVVHGDSEYTDRIMQTGVMRDEARIRSIKGLNHRLISLFADEGVSAVGINGYQRQLITRSGKELTIDTDFFKRLPQGPVLLVSTLVWDEQQQAPRPVPLARMVSFLRGALDAPSVYTFSRADKDEIIIDDKPDQLSWEGMQASFAGQHIPEEFQGFDEPLLLATARDFGGLPDQDRAIRIT